MRSLKFYIKKHNYPKTPFKIKKGVSEPTDREFLSFIYEHGPIYVNGAKFNIHQVYAEPNKSSVLSEILFFILIICSWLHFVTQEIPLTKWMVAIGMGIIVGSLIGIIRIDKQRNKAEKFNKS